MYTTLKKLLNVTALATGEAKINAIIKELITPYCDEVYTDPIGNLICLKKGNGEDKKKIMLAAHSDEHGFVATYLENNEILGKIASVDVTDLSDIQLWYGQQYQVELGDASRLEYKISYMKAAIAQMADYQSGVLDVSFKIWTDEAGYTPF